MTGQISAHSKQHEHFLLTDLVVSGDAAAQMQGSQTIRENDRTYRIDCSGTNDVISVRVHDNMVMASQPPQAPRISNTGEDHRYSVGTAVSGPASVSSSARQVDDSDEDDRDDRGRSKKDKNKGTGKGKDC